MSLILSGTDGLSDVDGSAATPAIRGTDANTGMFFPAADTIAFSEGGAEAMRIDSSGNVGIGTSSPLGKLDSSWGGRTAGQVPAILVGANSDSSTRSDNTQKMGVIGAAHYTNAQSPVGLISSNSYASNNDVYVGGGFAGSSAATTVSFWTAANNTTTQGTERMRITSGGLVGINTSSPTNTLQVAGGISATSSAPAFQASAAIMDVSAGVARFNATGADNSTNGIMTFNTANANASGFNERMRITSTGVMYLGSLSTNFSFTNGSAVDISGSGTGLAGTSTNLTLGVWNGPMVFQAGNNGSALQERMRIDSSGNLLVGTTTNTGNAKFFVDGSVTDNISRMFNSSATPFGLYIRYSGAAPNNTGQEFLFCNDTTATRFTARSNGGLANYSANDVNLSDLREKTNVELAGNYLLKICSIPVKTFNYIDQNREDDDGLTLGVVAQDVQAVAPELVSESDWSAEKDGSKMRLSIYQTDLQYALMKAIQELKAELDSVKAELQTLKGN